ncbi:rhodopsin-like [Acanthaster planci]|uniref:Rhodopsin-like n=1 Tax=Acanthaster planci TaxID=133434 RepID=A0A8B7Z097_ACAPL|nr:rhodopsin-like [Acanthaster planci]
MAVTFPTASLLPIAGNGSQLGPHLSRSGYTCLAVYLAVVCLLSVAGNAVVIFLYARYQSLHNVVNIFLLNICVADIIVAVLGTPLSLASSVAGHWLFGSAGCSWYGFICTFSGCAQIVGIAAVSLQRFFFVVKPFVARRLTTGGALVCVGFTWAYSLVAALPPALGWSEFVLEGAGTSCSVNWQTGSRSYTFFIFVMILVLPLSIIVFSYSQVLVTVKKMAKCQVGNRRFRRADKKVTIMVVVMMITFMVSWSPYAILALYSAFGNSAYLPPLVTTLPAMFAKASTAYNPVIYFLLHDKFREALCYLLTCRRFERNLAIGPTTNPCKNNAILPSTLRAKLGFPLRAKSKGGEEKLQAVGSVRASLHPPGATV